MTLSRGAEFISYLDLPYEVKRRLSSDGTADLGEWLYDHRREVVDALVEVGGLHQIEWPEIGPSGTYQILEDLS